jgi:hypothetical protein
MDIGATSSKGQLSNGAGANQAAQAKRTVAKIPIPVVELDSRDHERWELDSGWLAEETLKICSLANRTIHDVIEIGYRLSICKGHLDHGDWLPWLDRDFGWSEKTAERYLHLYELSKSDKLSNLSLSDLNLPLSALHIIAQPSTPQKAVDEVVKEAGNNKMSVKDVDAIVRKHKPMKKRTQAAKRVKPPKPGSVEYERDRAECIALYQKSAPLNRS